MRLERMGASFQTRLSFMRQLIRRMRSERWRLERLRFDLDAAGHGVAVYAAHGHSARTRSSPTRTKSHRSSAPTA